MAGTSTGAGTPATDPEGSPFPASPERTGARRREWLLALGVALVFIAVGIGGVSRYVQGFSLYRGFAPPRAAAFVHQHGSEQSFSFRSPATGGRMQNVLVYLPPGYAAHPTQRYPVFYLLHGVPGHGSTYLLTGRMGVWADTLYAQHKTAGIILVMPSGPTSSFADTEWANGIGPGQAWETFVARDLVQAVDARYRTIPSPQARAIGGLSEGGYGAFNIALHNPGVFGVVESWSGYALADNIPSIFGRRPALLAYNSPMQYLPRVATTLRRRHTYFWFYIGSSDPLLSQNRAFAAELARLGIDHHFFVVSGGHTWRLWRAHTYEALSVAVRRLTGGR